MSNTNTTVVFGFSVPLRAFRIAAGASAALSVAHFAVTSFGGRPLIRDVPLHFDILGHPGQYVRPQLLCVYPSLTMTMALSSLAIPAATSPPDLRMAVGQLAAGAATVLVAQVFATRIAAGDAEAMPASVVAALLMSVAVLPLGRLFAAQRR
jgi:hypothetical protein